MPTEPAPIPAPPDAAGTYLLCAACGARVRGVGWRPGMDARCRKCGGALQPPGDATLTLSAPDPLLNRTLGGVRIESRIGAGGMGTVYRGTHIALDKAVAIKVLPPEMLMHKTALERFQREARAAARLEHPNIVQVLNVGNEGSFHFIVMQFIQGESLARMVQRRGALPWQEALRFARDAARGLAQAHRQGVIHRDIKPDNILVGTDGAARVADFGLARTLDSSLSLSQTGQIMGTPDYMSPEQAQGHKTDGRSDVYSLGATLYFLLTAKRPFAAETPIAVIMKHVSEPPPPVRDVNPGVPESVANIVQKMLAKKPEERFQDCAAVVGALDAAERGETPVAASDLPAAVPPAGNGSGGPSQIVIESGSSGAQSLMFVGAGIAAVLVLVAIVVAMVKARNREPAATKPTAVDTGTPKETQPREAAEEALPRLAGELEAAISLRQWAQAGRIASSLDALRESPAWATQEARLSPSLKALRDHQASVADGRVVDLPGSGDRTTWEFESPTELDDFDRSILPMFSARLERGRVVGSGMLSPKELSIADGQVRLRLSVSEIERPFRKDDKKSDRPGLGIGRNGQDGTPCFALGLRVQESKESYAVYLEPGDGDRPKLTLAYFPAHKDDTIPVLIKTTLLEPQDKDMFDIAFSCVGDRLVLHMNGKAVLEGIDTRLTKPGRVVLVSRGIKASIDRFEVEALR